MTAPVRNPLVSVVVPTRNRRTSIGGAIQSILRQTIASLEVIVIDDGSKDGTSEEIRRFATADSRVTYKAAKKNLGAQGARNLGLEAARGEWVAFLDSDDEWLRESLAMRLEAAHTNGVEVVHTDCLSRDKDNTLSPFGIPPIKGEAYEEILRRPGPMFQGLLVSRRAMEKARPLNTDLIAYQEWDTSIRLARHFEFGFVPKPTFIYQTGGIDTISSSKLLSAKGYEQVVRNHQGSMLRHCGRACLIEHYGTIQRLYREAGESGRGRRARIMAMALSIPDRMRPRPR